MPRTSQILTSDAFIIDLPSGMLFSDPPICARLSINIQSSPCTLKSPTSLKVSLNIDSPTYLLNKTLSFTIKFIKNPDTVGEVGGFVVKLVDGTESPYENFTTIT